MRLLLALLAMSSVVFGDDPFTYTSVNEQKMPLVISAQDPNLTLESFQEWIEAHRNELRALIREHGAILFRDLPVRNADDFASVVAMVLDQQAMDYTGEGSRTKVRKGIYTSTEAPGRFHIPLHHELSCTDNPPAYICFYCEIAPALGSGQTLLGSTERVTKAVMEHKEVWDLF